MVELLPDGTERVVRLHAIPEQPPLFAGERLALSADALVGDLVIAIVGEIEAGADVVEDLGDDVEVDAAGLRELDHDDEVAEDALEKPRQNCSESGGPA